MTMTTCTPTHSWHRHARRLRTGAAAVAALAVVAAGLLSGSAWPAVAQTLSGGGGAKNVVLLRNYQDRQTQVAGSVQLNRVPGPSAAPLNLAQAYGSCTDCQTLAVALQIDLIARDATFISPENAAVAENYGCTRCYTVAHAIQYVFQVDDPTYVPPDVAALARDLDQELTALQTTQGVTVAEAEARIEAVVARFGQLAWGLRETRNVAADSPGATPSPTATVAAAATATVEPTLTASPAPTSTPSPTPIPTQEAIP